MIILKSKMLRANNKKSGWIDAVMRMDFGSPNLQFKCKI